MGVIDGDVLYVLLDDCGVYAIWWVGVCGEALNIGHPPPALARQAGPAALDWDNART
jgi:hypothetical protein